MAYPAAAIANEFLALGDRENKKLTQMQLQKLVFFAHGWNLALTGEPLVNERLLAWEYGPVVKSLWRAFSEFGSKAITKKARVPDWQGNELRWTTPHIANGSNRATNEFTEALVGKVWKEFKSFSAFQLSEMTHLPGSPWSLAKEKGSEFISDSDISRYFEDQKLTGSSTWSTHPTA